MQSRLPDINTYFVKFTNKALSSLESKNFSSCVGAINSINSLLPQNFRVRISNKEYEEKTSQNLLVECKSCKAQTNRKELKISKVIQNAQVGFLTDQSLIEVWFCPKCKVMAELQQTEFIQEEIPDPTYFNVVPNPPMLRDGLMSRTKYSREFTKWFWLVMGELGDRISGFRDENWQRGNEDDSYEDYLEGGEEND